MMIERQGSRSLSRRGKKSTGFTRKMGRTKKSFETIVSEMEAEFDFNKKVDQEIVVSDDEATYKPPEQTEKPPML